MLKNLEIRVTRKCNSRCLICHLWKTRFAGTEAEASQYEKLFSRAEFREIEEIFISGGEPFVRKDLIQVIETILGVLPKVKRFRLTTNGTYPEKAKELFKKLTNHYRIEDLNLSVSLEGDRKVNKKIRGIDSYDSALSTIKLCRKASPGLYTMILTTLTRFNCNRKSLDHLRKLAIKTGSLFSFRPFYNSQTYHYNYEVPLEISEKQKEIAVNFIKRYGLGEPFLKAQLEYLKTGKMPLMDKCLAGDVFADIRPDGSVYPCFNSTREIGDVERGIYVKKIKNLGRREQCPCCDEACFFPMLRWADYSTSNPIINGGKN
jgi:MoaA/NifB/PqqE/SkfB family radical SAM enzyme